MADVAGLDLVSFQDHPYQSRFLDSWTLLSYVAAATANVQLALNVTNLPLRRPAAVLAKSVASLDVLSHGRVQLGLGSGAFWDGVARMGGERLTAGQAVSALEAALPVIRGAWTDDGPQPLHDIEIWLGAYKPRMLALTGRLADGWLPSMGYADLGDLGPLNAAIDAAAVDAGRDPVEIRRLYNLLGSLSAEEIASLALEQGMSTFILAADDEAAVRRFAEETAPAVRELVDRARSGAPTPAPRPVSVDGEPFGVVPTPEGPRLSDRELWDESSRPVGPAPNPDARYRPDQQAAGQHLIDVHDHLRGELERLRELVAQLAAGDVDPRHVRSFLNRMTIRQNNWTLGVYCASYCRVVTGHHTLEDRSMFPYLRGREPGLSPVIDRLASEHETIAELLEEIDQAIIGLVSSEGIADVVAAVDALHDAMDSHLSYEERELVEPLARHGFG